MVRTTVKSSSAYVSIAIPPQYIGKELEVIVFDKNEGIESENRNGSRKKISFDALSIDTITFKFNREEANER
jgi:predicted nucleotidyltransferase